MLALGWIDGALLALYALVVVAVGARANRKQKTGEDYFLGGRRLRWWAVGVSLIATSFSGVSLVGGTEHGFDHGLLWLQLQLGDLLALGIVAVVFLPFFARLRLTTAYEYLERRFGPAARRVASALFVAQTLLRAALLVYAPAVVLAAILGWPVEAAILAVAVLAIAYSALGGLGAVVWTDLLQMSVVLLGVGYSLWFVGVRTPELPAIDWVRPAADTTTIFNLPGAFLAYAVLATSLFGTGQQAVQRFLSCTDLAAARRAALLNWVVGTIALGATLYLGAALARWGGAGADSTTVFARFLTEHLPAGVAGLMLAALLSAAMSSLDSAIHSMSTAAIVDFVRPWRGGADPAAELRLARWGTVAFGVLATAGALYAARQDEAILNLLVTWLGYFAGPLLGLFLLGLLTTGANQRGALAGVVLGFGATAAAVLAGLPAAWRFHPLYLAPCALAVTLGAGLLASLAGPRPDPARLRGLTWLTRE